MARCGEGLGTLERGQGTPVREGQTDKSAFAGFSGQRGGGRSGANFGVEFTVMGVRGVRRGLTEGGAGVFGTWCQEEALDLWLPACRRSVVRCH